jgi:predicted ABC-class ATPase
MGIKEGVTIITGGGFHGKSTLLNAIQAGIYNHITGDGREFVIPIPELVKIRAEDGMNIEKVDISTFINNLTEGRDTVSFSTPNASGSTSQAANIMESLEVGAKCIIMDEDTCSTNFLIRDKRMQELIPDSKEPITPYIDVAKPLYDQKKSLQ